MNWFLIALINPVVHAFVNHFDKYLISKFLKNGSVGSLILFSALFAVFALPFIYIFKPDVIHSVGFSDAVILMVNGAVLVGAIICYLYALEDDEASYVAPLFQLIPVFGFILGYLLLGEILTGRQVVAGLLILLGSLFLSLELSGNGKKIKTRLVLLMVGSSLLYAINAVVFKSVAVNAGFVDSVFWDMAGKFIFGVILFFVIRPYREQFLALIRDNGAYVLGLNIVNEIMGLVGEFALVLAVLYAPVALVQSVGGLQPAFVLIIGILLTKFLPHFGEEKLERKFLVQKFIGIAIISGGVYLLQLF